MEASLGTDSIVLQRQRQLNVLVAKNYANSGRTRCSQSVPLIALALAIIGIIAINFHAAESILKGEIESMHRTILLPERHWRPSPVAFPNDNGSVTTKALLQEIDTKTDILLDRQKVTNETNDKEGTTESPVDVPLRFRDRYGLDVDGDFRLHRHAQPRA